MISLEDYKQLSGEMVAGGQLYNILMSLCAAAIWQEEQEEVQEGPQEDDDQD
jgi:hypothetical protein